MPPAAASNPAPVSSAGSSMASASTSLCSQPTFDQPPQFPAPAVPAQQSAATPSVAVAPTPKMMFSAPAAVTVSQPTPVLLPAPLPMPPVLPWETACIQQPEPLEHLAHFLAQDPQPEEPAENSTLVHALAQEMTHEQSAEHIRQGTWCQTEMDKKRHLEMAQPAWKATIQRSQPSSSVPSRSSMAASRFPVSSLPGMPTLQPVQETARGGGTNDARICTV